jgi:hypothetical protein
MKGALTSKEEYQFDENGNLVAKEGETEEARSTRESIVLYVEGVSGNHPADVAASNDPEGEISPEALAVGGKRSISEKSEANDSTDPSFARDENKDHDESHDDDDNLHKSKRSSFRRK